MVVSEGVWCRRSGHGTTKAPGVVGLKQEREREEEEGDVTDVETGNVEAGMRKRDSLAVHRRYSWLKASSSHSLVTLLCQPLNLTTRSRILYREIEIETDR